MEEIEYLRQGKILVTSTRIEIDGQTFAVRNVGSVKVDKPGLPWIAALLLVGCLASAASGAPLGVLAFALVPAVWIYQQVRQRQLVLITGGGEVMALKSTNGAQVESLREAIAKAIAVR